MTRKAREGARQSKTETRNDHAENSRQGETPADRLSSLADRHTRTATAAHHRADLDLKALEQCLDRIYAGILADTGTGRTGTRMEEWLLDNRHIIDQTLEEIRKDLPPSYLRQLPLVEGEDESAPVIRVQDLARTLLREGAKPLDIDWLEYAVELYQDTTVLSIGELWALPTMLRLAIIDNLVKDAAERMETADSSRPVSPSAATVESEIQADEIAGDITSLRQLDAQDWRESFERLSRVDRVLCRDPAEAYARMDFKSRDRYRGAIEELARGTHWTEIAVAGHAVELCREADAQDHRTRHVGYYLVSEGRPRLEQALEYRLSPRRRLFRRLLGHPALVYFGLLGPMVLIPLFGLAVHLLQQQEPPLEVAAVTILAAVPVTGLAVAMLNGLVMWLLSPRVLPRMNFEKGIPCELRTAVVMPVLLGGRDDIDHALERIEINYLNNEDEQLVYAVLSDWTDAPEASIPGDTELLERAASGIRALNRRYGRDPERGPFLLLHRERLWNEAEGCWMGWERKRGKLSEFNRLLAGADGTSYATWVGDRNALSGVKFVITLDADTHLPAEAARLLVATIGHPLNRAVIDADGNIKGGYSILQPRLAIDPDSTQSTRFTEIFAGDTTLDLYTHATSDVYHDLFAEGSYAGKGLYDWRAFEQTLRHRIPENTLLSHDLLEGVHARTALLSDVVLLEQYPAGALAYMRRLHRWVRGDWQLLPWLAPMVPSSTGRWFRNPLSVVHQWKIIDNLRRSLQPPAVLALLVLTWFGLIGGKLALWTIVFAAFLGAPLIAEIFDIVGRGLARPTTLPQRLRDAPRALRDRLEHWALSLALLPYESYMVLDAIGRTLFRLFVTKRRMLEWISAAHVHRRLGAGNSLSVVWREMWVSPALAIGVSAGLYGFGRTALAAAGPLLLVWLTAPQLMWWVNRPLHEPVPASPADSNRLRRISRRTWLFFEQFIGPDNHWLPPDNFQEEPLAVVAARTSPTNIGMALASALAAYDLGYIDPAALAARLRNTYEVLERLQRFRGHWLNWYETRELHPLQPEYVSTVDSGNLAASLIAVARGMQEIAAAPLRRAATTQGIADTVLVLTDTLTHASREHKGEADELTTYLRRMRSRLLEARNGTAQWKCIKRLQERDALEFKDLLLAAIDSQRLVMGREELGQLRAWLDELRRQLRQVRRSLETLQPWLPAFDEIPELYDSAPLHSAVAEHWRTLREFLEAEVPLRRLPDHYRAAIVFADDLAKQAPGAEATDKRHGQAVQWINKLRADLHVAAGSVGRLAIELRDLVDLSDRWVSEMDFRFLYDDSRHLFRIGYNVTTGSPDPHYYDLLASEARLTGFVAIAKGDAPVRHWLHLGRPFRRSGGATVLMSWGATLFEYLMPSLFMSTPPDTLMRRACRSAITMHREFAGRLHIPWGISESGYYQLDDQQHYQYRAFGVPGLGFRRDLGDRLVVAPYSSVMALPFNPAAVVQNLIDLESVQGLGLYGLYEAVDFGRIEKTAPRRARVVRSYMSHHQGMVLLAIDNFLNGDPMVRRFHADRRVARISMLLHERLPQAVPGLKTLEARESVRHFAPRARVEVLPVSVASDDVPRFNVLSNGHYTTVASAAGGGGSQWDGIALTRWQPDPVRDEGGQWVYIKDLDTGTLLSIGREPVGAEPGSCTVYAGPHVVQYQRRALDLFCQMDVALSSQHDVEARRVTIRNDSGRPRRILVAAYAELVLAPPGEFLRHPAFARLFVESEYVESERALLYRRRPRSSMDKPLYLAHSIVVPPELDCVYGWETDRTRFLGRYGRAARPEVLRGDLAGFSGSTGAVLDAVIGNALELVVPAKGAVELAFLTAVGASRPRILSMLRSYRSMARVDWIFEQARMQTEQELYNLRIDPGDVTLADQLLASVLGPRTRPRPRRDLERGASLQSILWSRGISGDRPLVLMCVRDGKDTGTVERLLQLHTYLCARQIAVDLALIDEESSGYAQPTRDRLERFIADIRGRTQRRLAGSVFIVPGNELDSDARSGLLAAARLVLDTNAGSLAEQLAPTAGASPVLPPFVPVRSAEWQELPVPSLLRRGDLLYDNSIGGFSADDGAYLIHLEPGKGTPAPWSNVIANPSFGCLLTESGSSCTWAGNSSERRLTPWPNDPVGDHGGEVVYLRDEETGRVWTATPQPIPDDNPYQVVHATGYSEYRHNSPGLLETYRVHVDRDAPVKLCCLTLANEGTWTRRVTVTFYVEWVLGTSRSETAAHIRCGFDPDSGALLARNVFDRMADSNTAFLGASRPPHGLTTDRVEFLGRGGDTGAPAALYRIGMSGAAHGGNDPCAAYQVHLDLPAGTTETVHFVLGQGNDRDDAIALCRRFREPDKAQASFDRSRAQWDHLLGAVQVETPEPAMDLLLNHWLPYQVMASRLWGRTGYYQSSGAYGFRDQLQDVMALSWAAPNLAREHILRAAGRQFTEGDVLHWWHEAPLRGVRTRCSDDLLWLPFVTSHYVNCTGDYSILDEQVTFLSGSELRRDENEHYAEFSAGDDHGSLYEHCCRAMERAAVVGPHGLPVIGSGDWNDGFNRISTTGQGESVWLAWFLVRVCRDFAPVCERRGDARLAAGYRELADDLRQRAENEAWDGQWYRRAYYDDGTPLGSAASDECRIDLIAQAWAVLSAEQPTERDREAMSSAWRELVRDHDRLVLLLAPPFDRGTGDPGYIKGYPPGIRENGAQYTHAATWAVWAAARLGDGERAMSLFRLLNPILRCQDALGVQRYRVEPYVLSGDIYSVPPHTGRGGWSWYSGAAAWLYRAGVEVLLGLKQLGNELEVSPCLPPEWEGYRARLRRGSSWYRLEVSKPPGVSCGEPVIVKDGKRIEGRRIPFLDDGVDHAVEVTLQPAGDWEIDTGQP